MPSEDQPTGSVDLGENRRIGQRVRVTDLVWTWEVPKARGRFTIGPTRLVLQEAKVVNLSVTGAGVLAPRNKGLHPGMQVAFLLGEATGVVQIRQVRATFNEESAYYGVRFVVLDDEIQRILYGLVAAERRHLDPAWHNAR